MSYLTIYKAGSRPSQRGNPEYFTGTVWIEPVVDAPGPARISAAKVMFEPGARTNWHTHPYGQTLQVLTGAGYVQVEGQERLDILPGDTVWIPPHLKHWHGARADSVMIHLALQEKEGGSAAEWLEPVSDAQYKAG